MIELGNALFIVYGCTRDLLLIKLTHGAVNRVQWRSPITSNYPSSELILNQTPDSLVPDRGTCKAVDETPPMAEDQDQAMPYIFCLSDLPKLDLQKNRGTDFTAWRVQWDSYSNLSGFINQLAAKQVQALSLCFSRETLAIVQNLGLNDGARDNVAQVIQALQ